VAVRVYATAAKEAMLHHTLAKQEKSDYQCGQQQEPSNLEHGCSRSSWGSIIPVPRHLTILHLALLI
jgi:hypothetical protein